MNVEVVLTPPSLAPHADASPIASMTHLRPTNQPIIDDF
jgi:hypothetical protein